MSAHETSSGSCRKSTQKHLVRSLRSLSFFTFSSSSLQSGHHWRRCVCPPGGSRNVNLAPRDSTTDRPLTTHANCCLSQNLARVLPVFRARVSSSTHLPSVSASLLRAASPRARLTRRRITNGRSQRSVATLDALLPRRLPLLRSRGSSCSHRLPSTSHSTARRQGQCPGYASDRESPTPPRRPLLKRRPGIRSGE